MVDLLLFMFLNGINAFAVEMHRKARNLFIHDLHE